MGKALIRLGMGIMVFLATILATGFGVLLGPFIFAAATFSAGMDWVALAGGDE